MGSEKPPAVQTSTDAYPHVEKWVQEWFAPVVAARLAAGDTGRGLTWCAQWWAHPGVAGRLHALWQAWEAARQSRDAAAMSSWWTSHVDHHLRALLDGEHGPMWRCSPTQHRPIPHLAVVDAPDGWFDPATTDGER